MQSSGKFMNLGRAIVALLCATVLSPCALLADKTTNTYNKSVELREHHMGQCRAAKHRDLHGWQRHLHQDRLRR